MINLRNTLRSLFAVVCLHTAHCAELTDYTLAPGDFIKVQVFQELDLDRELKISQEGSVNLPLVGSVTLAGETVQSAQEKVRNLYLGDYLINPQINITVLQYSLRTVNVLGQVNQPGSIPYPPEQTMTLLDAISKAGGFNRLANRKAIKLTRAGASGTVEKFTINADEILSGRTQNQWILQPQDVIFVEEGIL